MMFGSKWPWRKMILIIRDYSHALIIPIILFLIYKIFPSLFFLFLSYSPVFAITSLLLASLLYFGEKEKEPNFNEIKDRELNRENNSQVNTEYKSFEDNIYVNLANNFESDEKSGRKPNFNEENKDFEVTFSDFESDKKSENNISQNGSFEINSSGLDEKSENNISQNGPFEINSSDLDEKSENNISQNGSCEKERFRRLTSLIERRRARMSLRHEIKKTLTDPEPETLIDDNSPRFKIRVSNLNPNNDEDKKEGFVMVPGSAPSVLLHRSPFEPVWNRNGLTGHKRVSRLDPFLVTEMDNKESLETDQNDQNDEIRPGRGKDLEQNEGNIEGGNANSYSDTILLSEYLNLCCSEIAKPIKDQIKMEIKPQSEENEILIETIIQENDQNAPDQFSNGEIKNDTSANAQIRTEELNDETAPDQFSNGGEIKKDTTAIGQNAPEKLKDEVSVMEIFKDNILVSKEKGEFGSVEMGQTGQTESEIVVCEKNGNLNDETGQTESEMVVCEEIGNLNDETGQMGRAESEMVIVDQNGNLDNTESGQTGQSDSQMFISAQNGNMSDEMGQTGQSEQNGNLPDETVFNLKRSPILNSISSNLKKVRKQNKAVETSSSSSNSD